MVVLFSSSLCTTSPKNYQIWYHRRALLEFRFKGETDDLRTIALKELSYIDRILCDDSKNYHAWSHRQWIMRTLDDAQLWTDEVQYSHSKILADPRNNSAWNQRWFALHNENMSTNGKEGPTISLEKSDEETNYALEGAKLDPYNESPWRYLIGIIMEQWRLAQRNRSQEDAIKVSNLVKECINRIKEMQRNLDEMGDKPTGACTNLLSALADLLALFSSEEKTLREAKSLLIELITADPVRRKYWKSRADKIDILLENVK